jgi:hypothetical protein
MKAFFATVLTGCLLLHPIVVAAQAVPSIQHSTGRSMQDIRARVSADAPLMSAVRQDGGRLLARTVPSQASAETRARQGRSWVGRHPALFGALVGAGAGIVAAGTMENELFCSTGSDEDCLFYTGSRFAVGAGIGAGVGALVGWIVGMRRK